MTRFDGQDGAGSGEISLGHDVRCSSEISERSSQYDMRMQRPMDLRADADAFQDGGGGDEGFDVGDTEGVRALSDRLRASRGQGGGQEADVGHLVRGNFLQVFVEGRVEACVREVGLGEVVESFTVELVLQVLEGQRVLEDLCTESARIRVFDEY